MKKKITKWKMKDEEIMKENWQRKIRKERKRKTRIKQNIE